MVWQEKLQEVISLVPDREELMIVFDAPAVGVPAEHILRLKEVFPPLPEDYLAFLRRYDGLQIDMFVLFGSPESHFPSLFSRLETWRGILDFSRIIPIGEDAAGAAFCIDTGGSVCLVDSDPPNARRAVSGSFSALLDEFFMGERFLDFFPFGREDSEWLDLLCEMGWLSE